MRVTRLDIGRLRREERGAVLMMVAISLLVLLGMLVLTFDLGRVVAIRRDMVNASDAAALAAARECALGHGSGSASAAAASLVGQNSSGGSLVLFDAPECDTLTSTGPKIVTVRSTVEVDYFFAQIFGFDSGPVTTQARAQWGAALAGNPVPIRVNLNALLVDCGVDFGTTDQVTCNLGFGNQDEFGASNDWSWLWFGGPNGEGWNTTDCTSQAGGSNDPIFFLTPGVTFQPGVLNSPPPTYVCSYSGNAQSVVGALAARVGDVLTFPIVDTVSYPVIGQGANQAFPVVALSRFRVIQVHEQPNAEQFCPDLVDQPGQDEFCLIVRWEGPHVTGGLPGDGPIFGLTAIRLVD